jgi:hypothetical protein
MWELALSFALKEAASLISKVPPEDYAKAAQLFEGWIAELATKHGASHPVVAALSPKS